MWKFAISVANVLFFFLDWSGGACVLICINNRCTTDLKSVWYEINIFWVILIKKKIEKEIHNSLFSMVISFVGCSYKILYIFLLIYIGVFFFLHFDHIWCLTNRFHICRNKCKLEKVHKIKYKWIHWGFTMWAFSVFYLNLFLSVTWFIMKSLMNTDNKYI